MLERVSLLGGCGSELSARRAHLAETWLAEEKSPDASDFRGAVQDEARMMASACPDVRGAMAGLWRTAGFSTRRPARTVRQNRRMTPNSTLCMPSNCTCRGSSLKAPNSSASSSIENFRLDRLAYLQPNVRSHRSFKG